MEWVSSWIQGIIIAVIISTIIEMILPEGSSKKYIKVVIGVYILFSIISPVINKVTGNDFRVSDIFDLDEYIETSKNNSNLQNQISDQNETQIKEVYLSSIKNDIKEKVENKGYAVENINLEVEDDEQYTLKKLNLQVSKETIDVNNNAETNDNQIVESVDEVKIEVGEAKSNNGETSNSETSNNSNENNNSNEDSNKKSSISSQEKKELKEYLSGVYEINTKNIFINE